MCFVWLVWPIDVYCYLQYTNQTFATFCYGQTYRQKTDWLKDRLTEKKAYRQTERNSPAQSNYATFETEGNGCFLESEAFYLTVK